MALGYRHYYGLGVPQSCWTAATYYQPVAEQLLDEALQAGGLPQIERLRLNLHASQGLRTDRHREVLQWYQYSADQGNVAAQAMVGQVLNAGTHGISRDHSAAAHYLHRAGGAGDAEAMANLGSMYAAGMGVEQDYAQALSWLQKAVERHDKLGLYCLGYMYLSGKGVGQKFDRAFKYFSNAAEGGDRDSNFFLGVMHLQVRGGRWAGGSRAELARNNTVRQSPIA
jgi:SEL1 protein